MTLVNILDVSMSAHLTVMNGPRAGHDTGTENLITSLYITVGTLGLLANWH